ncbi:MAG: heavy metal translocating P-type ATPase metal-binding domain-containing protein [Verrucomicrobiota bacterium]
MAEALPTEIKCRHCGISFSPNESDRLFCCDGCRHVYGLIQEKSLQHFYDLRRATIPPAGAKVFDRLDFSWLREAQKNAEDIGICKLELTVRGISGVCCVWLTEQLFKSREGAQNIRVKASNGRLRLGWKPNSLDLAEFAEELMSFGYRIAPADKESHNTRPSLTSQLKISAAIAICTVLVSCPFYLGMEASHSAAGALQIAAFLLATASLFFATRYFFPPVFYKLRVNELHAHLPICIGLFIGYLDALIAWQIKEAFLFSFDSFAVFMFLILAGCQVQEWVAKNCRTRLSHSSTWVPSWHTYRDGRQIPKLLEELKAGDQITIAPGQVIPLRGQILDDPAMIGMDWITGDNQPTIIQPGASVPAGAVNISSSRIIVEASENWDDSPLKPLMQVSEEAFHPNSIFQKILRYYIGFVLIIAFLGGGAWLISGYSLHYALQIVLSILVVTSPWAFGLAIPLADELAVKTARDFGVFVRKTSLWYRLHSIENIAFDESGINTLEAPFMEHEACLDNLEKKHRQILLDIVSASPHPISKALRRALVKFEPKYRPQSLYGISETPGSGIEWKDGDTTWKLGHPSWALGGPFPQQNADCVFTKNGVPFCQFNFHKEVRTDATPEIKALLKDGFNVYLLSKEPKIDVQRMAALVGLPIENGIGALSSRNKANWIGAHQPSSCLLIGDSTLNPEAFAAAYCKATPTNTDKPLKQQADFYFLGKNIGGIYRTFQVSRQRNRAIHLVLCFLIVYNVVALGLSLAGFVNPLVAMLILPTSSIVTLQIISRIFKEP